jgi:MYXO-CTERM domain-containing protein
LTFPSLAGAAVVWTATFESGTLSEFRGGVNLVQPNGTRKNVEVLGEQVYSGKFAGKITVHPDDTFTFNQNRADIGHPSTLTAQGAQVWLSGHYMMPADAQTRMEFAFFESNTSFLNAMDFWVEPRMGGGTNIVYGVGDLGRTVVWTGNFTIGVWHQVAIHVLWSTSATVGTVDVWFDGVQVVTDRKAQTSRDTNTLFFETGLHRRTPGTVTETIYLDDFIEADNFADAKIAPPIGSDAGVGDASNTGAGGSEAGGAGGAATDGGTSAGGTTGAGGATGAGTGGSTSVTGTGGSTSTGTGGSTSVTGTTGSATTGTAGGSTTSAGTTGTGSGAGPDAGSGCSCGVLRAGDDVPKWWAGALLLGGAIAARRRRRS